MSASLCTPGPGGTIFAALSTRPRGEVQVAWPFGRRSSVGCTLRTQYLSIGDVGAHAVFLSCPTWQWGAQHGVNEYGVAIAGGRLPISARPAGDRDGLIGADLVRLGLERARTADEALEVVVGLLETCGLGGADEIPDGQRDDGTFLIVDPRGAVVFAADGRGGDGGDDTVGGVSTRCPDGIALADGVPPEPARVAPSGVPGLRAVAAHLRQWSGAAHSGSRVPAASMMAELPPALDEGEPLRVYVAPGSPDMSIFVPAFPRTAAGPPPFIPFEVSGDELWQAADRLRVAVEDSTDAGPEVRALLASVEDDLWAEADDVLGDPARWPVMGASWGSRALHALRSCIPSSD